LQAGTGSLRSGLGLATLLPAEHHPVAASQPLQMIGPLRLLWVGGMDHNIVCCSGWALIPPQEGMGGQLR